MKTTRNRHRSLCIESLESRELLSVNTLEVPQYSSLPGANYAVFLDFNGNSVGTRLNGSDGSPLHAFDVDGNNDSFSAQELQMIKDLWTYTAEMYRPFNINVTTVQSEAYGKKGAHVCFGGTGVGTAWVDVVGGAINNGIDAMIGLPKGYGFYEVQACGQGIVHETGHNFGLNHDGDSNDEYYWGHNIVDSHTGTSGYWNTVMGGEMLNSSVQIVQFSQGEYKDYVGSHEDDLQVIAQRTGYRPDTGLEFVTASDLQTATGIIEQSGDADSTTITVGTKGIYSFEALAGITIGGKQVSSLYYVLTLTNNSTGDTVFQKYSPLNTFKVSYKGELAAGTYTLSIAGAGIDATGTMKGFTEYGSLGSYTITMNVPTNDALPTPLNLQAEALTSRNVNLTWDAVTDATLYQICWVLADGSERLLGTVTDAEYTTARLPVGENTLRVYALADGVKSDAAEVTTTVKAVVTPAVPTNFKAVPQASRNVNLTWTAVSGATHYQIYWKNTKGKNVVIGTSETASFRTPRVAIGSNTFYVYAWADDVRSKGYATVTTTVKAVVAPSVPTNLQAEALESRNVNLTWDSVTGATAYQVYWVLADGSERLLRTTTDTEYTTARLPNGENTLHVYALASDGKSDAAEVTTTVGKILPVPTNLQAKPLTSRNVNLTWDSVTGATAYQVYWVLADGNERLLKTVTDTKYTTARLPNGENTLRVYALSSDGKSDAAEVTTTVGVTDVPDGYNVYEWNLVQSQGLADYAAWENGRLVRIYANNAGLKGALDLSGCTNLRYLYCSYNELTSLDVSGCANLEYLDCEVNQLTSLDVSGCTNLRALYCGLNQLTSLDVSGLTNLQQLWCYSNQLTLLNVSGYTELEIISCYNNQLTLLDVSGLTGLHSLYCNGNQLTSLNVSGLDNLQELWCFGNRLTSLNLNNTGFTGYAAVEQSKADFGIKHTYTYPDGTERALLADTDTQIVFDVVTSITLPNHTAALSPLEAVFVEYSVEYSAEYAEA